MAPHSSTLAWKVPWTEEPGKLQPMGSLRVKHDWLHFHFSLSCIGEGNGNPLQCSCLENPKDGEPGGLPSLGSHRVRHDWSDLAAAAATEKILVVKIKKREIVSLTMKWTSGGSIHKNRVHSKRTKLYELGTVCLQFWNITFMKL